VRDEVHEQGRAICRVEADDVEFREDFAKLRATMAEETGCLRAELAALRRANDALGAAVSQLTRRCGQLERTAEAQQTVIDEKGEALSVVQRELAAVKLENHSLRAATARPPPPPVQPIELVVPQPTAIPARPSEPPTRPVPGKRQFAPGSDVLGGIIAHLTNRCGGNVHDKGIVIATASSVDSTSAKDAAKNALDLTVASRFLSSRNEKNDWLCLDFRDKRIIPTHYTIRCNYGGDGRWSNLTNWLVAVSMDGAAWIEIDRREGNVQLHAENAAMVFAVKKNSEGRFIRLMTLGKSQRGDDILVVTAFEIFGTLIE
jgi:hypothetical protein